MYWCGSRDILIKILDVDQQVWKFELMIQLKVWYLRFSVDHKVPKIDIWMYSVIKKEGVKNICL